MPFLTLNGYTVSVAIDSSSRRPKGRGKRSRAYRGQIRDGTRGQRREFKLRACFKDHEEAETLISVVNGEGHMIYFRDGLQAGTGLTPEVCSLFGVLLDKAESPFSSTFEAGSLEITNASNSAILRYDAQLCDEWTLHFWYKDSSVWHVVTKRSDGVFYEDGVRDDTQWVGPHGNIDIRVDDGRVTISGSGFNVDHLHHLAILPYKAHENFITAWHASTTPWSDLPALRMEGDLINTDHEHVFGSVSDVAYVQKPSEVSGFGWVNNSEIVDFTLTEVPPGFLSEEA